eukprot:651200-Prymnesium_polylepis.2
MRSRERVNDCQHGSQSSTNRQTVRFRGRERVPCCSGLHAPRTALLQLLVSMSCPAAAPTVPRLKINQSNLTQHSAARAKNYFACVVASARVGGVHPLGSDVYR